MTTGSPPPLGSELPRLTTERLVIRWIIEADLDGLLEVWGDDRAMQYMAHPPLADRAAARDFLTSIEDGFVRRTLFQWGVAFRREGPELTESNAATRSPIVGTITLAGLDWRHRRAEIGFVLAPAYWRRGLMREAVSRVLDYAFDGLGLHRIEADVDPRNVGSIALVKALGFVREGLLRERYFDRGEIQDAAFFGLLASDWRQAGRSS